MSRHAGDLRLALEVMAGDGASDLRLRTPVSTRALAPAAPPPENALTCAAVLCTHTYMCRR